jgi:hypothetical protein
MYRIIIAFFLILPVVFSCENQANPINPSSSIPEYDSNPITISIPSNTVNEASGICDSRSMAGNVWVQEDGSNPNVLHLFSHQGNYVGKTQLPFPNRDWEDITIGKGPQEGRNYIYLADIGDNLAAYNNEYYIYRFLEPQSLNEKIQQYDRIAFRYSDGSRDAEAILLDPATKDIYIVTKREFNVRLYHLPYPQSTTEFQTANFIQNIGYQVITSGGISSDGKEIVLRNYSNMYYWYRKDNESIIQALARSRDKVLPFVKEIQEEGFCFDKDNKGIFSIGERPDGSAVANSLYYYKKK